MKRWEIINAIIRKNGYERYLEIGTWMGECISKVECPIRHGVDPGDKPTRVEDCKGKWAPVARQLRADPKMHFDPYRTESNEGYPTGPRNELFHETSDSFFEMLEEGKDSGTPFIPFYGDPYPIKLGFYDFIFIDGCHTHAQSYDDFVNSWKWLQDKGTIMLHDTLPASEARAKPDGMDNGEVWKTAALLHCTWPELEIVTVDTDEGCTLISSMEKGEAYSEAPLSECLMWKYFAAHREELLNVISVGEFEEMMK